MKKILITIFAVFLAGFLAFAPNVFSAQAGTPCKCADGSDGIVTVNTAILSGCECNGEKGGAIMNVLRLVVNIMSIGIGVLGVIGISISGIQYLTAGGNEEQTRKAKRRIFEIVLGLAIYVVIYALLYFLLPGFNGVNTPITP